MDSNKIINLAKQYIEENNQGNKNPYHNNNHMLFVCDMCLKIYDDYISKNRESIAVIEENKLILSLAALFHDFNHSGGKQLDSENIKLAIEGFYNFYSFCVDLDLTMSLFLFDKIIAVIECTQFPHFPISDKAILCNIIRDADTISRIYDGWENSLRNICKEINKSVESMIPIQHKFIHNLTFKTEYAQKISSERKKDVLNQLLLLKN